MGLKDIRPKIIALKARYLTCAFWSLVLWVFIFGGCVEQAKFPRLGSSKKADVVGEIPVEQRKAGLLKQLDQKFENPEAHYQLGQLYHSEGLWSQAEYHYNIAIGFKPDHREAQAALVKVMLDSGNKAKASHYADIFMKQVAGSATESLKLAMAFQKQQLDEQALVCYRQALHLAPTSARIHRQMGYYYLSKGDRERAKEYLSRSFDLNPNQPEVAGELGRLGVEVKRPRTTGKDTKKIDKDGE